MKRRLTADFVRAVREHSTRTGTSLMALAQASGFPLGSLVRLSPMLTGTIAGISEADLPRLRALATIVGFEGELFR